MEGEREAGRETSGQQGAARKIMIAFRSGGLVE
jgi:hypothetical protein